MHDGRSRQLATLLSQHLDIPPEEQEAFIAYARAEPYIEGVPFLERQDRTGVLRSYELQEKIGEGQFGVVHRALQPAVQREVAIKIIKPQYANQPDFIRRFETEAQIVARLEHPHIVPLYDYWREASGAYLVMRLLRGGSAQDTLAKGPWSLVDTVRLVNQIIQRP